MTTPDKLWRLTEKFLDRVTPFQIAVAIFASLFAGTCLVRLWASSARQTKFEVEYSALSRPEQTIKKADRQIAGPNLVDPAILYADRLREASAIAIGLSLAIIDDRIKNKRLMTNLGQIFAAAEERNLFPPLIRVNAQTRALESQLGKYYLNYRAVPFCLEIVSIGDQGTQSGDNFVLRIPDETGTMVKSGSGEMNLTAFATVWTSPDVSAQMPRAFAPGDDFIHAGWRQETLRTADIAPDKLAALSESFKQTMANSGK